MNWPIHVQFHKLRCIIMTPITKEASHDKIQAIGEALRAQVLDPAKAKAADLIARAEADSAEIIAKAEKRAAQVLETAKLEAIKQQTAFGASLQLAKTQALQSLKAEIETKLFSDNLSKLLEAGMRDAKLVSGLLSALIEGVRKEGVFSDLLATVGKSIDKEAVLAALGPGIVALLKDKTVHLGESEGGVSLTLKDKKLTLQCTEEGLKELLAASVRKDFRELIFMS